MCSILLRIGCRETARRSRSRQEMPGGVAESHDQQASIGAQEHPVAAARVFGQGPTRRPPGRAARTSECGAQRVGKSGKATIVSPSQTPSFPL